MTNASNPKSRRHPARIAAAAACALALATAAGCAADAVEAQDLMKGVQPSAAQQEADFMAIYDAAPALNDFAMNLLAQEIAANPQENTLVSPLSAAWALGMAANGALGDTRAQIEGVLGMGADEANAALGAYSAARAEYANDPLHAANSIWFKQQEGFSPLPEFLQANADSYRADAYAAPFDESTKDSINAWVRENTNGMIDGIVDEIPPEAVMYLVNALAFDAQWLDPYEKDQVELGTFTAEDGSETEVDMMSSVEGTYLQSDSATGFAKPYENGAYRFVALLPNEGVSVDELAASLDGEALAAMFSSSPYAEVHAAMPRFSAEYDTDLSGALATLGMPDAFDVLRADFGAMATWDDSEKNLFIGRVLQKCAIDVHENGTEAAAATAMQMDLAASASAPEEPEIKYVRLDRPFLYLVMDGELPLFAGIVRTVG